MDPNENIRDEENGAVTESDKEESDEIEEEWHHSTA